jgi:hypothetical protein
MSPSKRRACSTPVQHLLLEIPFGSSKPTAAKIYGGCSDEYCAGHWKRQLIPSLSCRALSDSDYESNPNGSYNLGLMDQRLMIEWLHDNIRLPGDRHYVNYRSLGLITTYGNRHETSPALDQSNFRLISVPATNKSQCSIL